jgi:transcriptional regulator with XRE-family HTH domain
VAGEVEDLASALKRVRKRVGWTQERLAEHAQFSRSTIAAVEGGHRPSVAVLRAILQCLPEDASSELAGHSQAASVLNDEGRSRAEDDVEDMVGRLTRTRRSPEIDISGVWSALWLTTTSGEENRNYERIIVRRRWNGSWEFENEVVSPDNPDGGYLWAARMELFDNRHLLGYYIARERNVTAKGSLCLELQTNGKEIVGVWDGLSFDTMWAWGFVAMCDETDATRDSELVLDRFVQSRPEMPYSK